jgi:hypothetical protein
VQGNHPPWEEQHTALGLNGQFWVLKIVVKVSSVVVVGIIIVVGTAALLSVVIELKLSLVGVAAAVDKPIKQLRRTIK